MMLLPKEDAGEVVCYEYFVGIIPVFSTFSNFFKLFQKIHIQGQPLGFDTKYLALVDRNMQVRFSLKVVRES